MEPSADRPSDPDVPYCPHHRVRGKPGEEWLGWKCPKCEEEWARGRRWRELKALPRDLRMMFSSLCHVGLMLVAIGFPWILLTLAAIVIIWLIRR